jgi:hypothetical protein
MGGNGGAAWNDLRGQTVGLVGWGQIARRFAELLEPFGCRLLICSDHVEAEDLERFHARRASLGELFAASRVVSLHKGMSERNRGLIGRELRPRFRGAVFVNTARAGLVEESALVELARKGEVTLALDVFHEEPLAKRHPARVSQRDPDPAQRGVHAAVRPPRRRAGAGSALAMGGRQGNSGARRRATRRDDLTGGPISHHEQEARVAKSLVTGGAGFIGSHVARHCLQRGDEVTVLDDLSGGFEDHVPAGCRFVEGSVTDAALVGRLSRRALRLRLPPRGVRGQGLSHFIRRFNYTNNVVGTMTLVNESVKSE